MALKEIGNFPDISFKSLPRKTIEEVLKSVDISFSVENVSRATTHEICEGNDSYTQQSMRYVIMRDGAFIIPPTFSDVLRAEFSDTMNFLLENYQRLSELKDEFKDERGRPKSNWFKFAPIEDARYGLALATPSNILVTMDGGKLLNFFGSLSDGFEAQQIFQSLFRHMPKGLAELCQEEIGTKDFSLIEGVYRDKLDKALEETFVEMLPHRFERAGIGALTSTNEATPSDLIALYEQDKSTSKKLSGVAKRVLGYGHGSVAEHAKTKCGIGVSLVTYHQFERHRIPSNIREDFKGLPIDRAVITPPLISGSEEATGIFESSVEASRNLREKIMNEAPEYNHLALLNGTKLGVYSNMNARAFKHISGERLCNNAQWEIQYTMEELALKLRDQEPELYKDCAPKCITHKKCPEGKLSCGRQREMIERYRGK
ncbi:FAD-dependent thymidylate synthase [Candidatus Pacearchaeota archaeon]|nr:FAD-dependent thymidylate synthase [Candidatus Pacearchaeota archaeon]